MDKPAADFSRTRPLWHLVVGFALVVGVLTYWGGWPLPFVIFAIIAMIVFHEAGHFVTARLTGMKTTEFFVGFGPRLWSRTRGETEYGVKAIWAGGYVKILGMNSAEDVSPEDELRTFRAATYPRRVLVASAGSLMHVLLALILVFLSLLVFGHQTSEKVSITGFYNIASVKQNPAQLALIRPGDVVVKINGHDITSANEFQRLVHASANKSESFLVRRRGHLVSLIVTPLDGRHYKAQGKKVPLAPVHGKATGIIGVELATAPVRTTESVWSAIPGSFTGVGSIISQTSQNVIKIFEPSGIGGIFHLVTNSKAAAASASNPTQGPVRPTSIFGAGKFAYQLAKQDPAGLFILFAAINIGIGFVNMLPMLPLDGGHVAVATYERIRTRRGRPRYVADVTKLLPFVYAFVGVLLLLFLSSLYLDITHPINF